MRTEKEVAEKLNSCKVDFAVMRNVIEEAKRHRTDPSPDALSKRRTRVLEKNIHTETWIEVLEWVLQK